MEEAAKKNSDGWGLAFVHEGRIKFVGGWSAKDIAPTIKGVPEGVPWMFHARFATHGAAPTRGEVSDDAIKNRQPFVNEAGWAVAHNGVMSHYEAKGKGWQNAGPSDSLLFAQDVASKLAPVKFTDTGKAAQDERRNLRKLIKTGGNKVAFLYSKPVRGSFHMVGDWHEEGGVFYSNTGYKSYTPVSTPHYTNRHGYWGNQGRHNASRLALPSAGGIPRWDDLVGKTETWPIRQGDGRSFLRVLHLTKQTNYTLILRDVEEQVIEDPEGAAHLIYLLATGQLGGS